jgi:hypothetical protein
MSGENDLNKLPSHTAWVVWLSVIVTGALMILQYVGKRWFGLVEILPHETAAWGLAFIVGGYTGTDRIAYAMKSRSLEYGTMDMGNVGKLKLIIFCMLGLVIEATILRVFFRLEGMALEQLLIGFSTSGGLYAIGNKIIKAASTVGGAHTLGEASTIVTSGGTTTTENAATASSDADK